MRGESLNKAKQLKKLLGDKYSYCQLVSKANIVNDTDQTIAALEAGCIKIEAYFCSSPSHEMLYDIFVHDVPEAQEWLCYDTIASNGSAREKDMAKALDCYVQAHGLDYIKCHFEKIKGKTIKNTNIK